MDILKMKEIPVTSLKGIGEERGKILSKLKIETLYDLVYYFPREYENRSGVKEIAQIQDGECAVVYGMIAAAPVEKRIRQGLSICKYTIKDGSGNAVITFYNQPFVKNTLKYGQWFYFYGKMSKSFGINEIQTPVYDRNLQGIVPVYPLTKGLSQNVLKNMMKSAFDKAGEIEEYIFQEIKEDYNLCDLDESLKGIHFPSSVNEVQKYRRRLAFDELLILQLTLSKMRNKLKNEANGFSFGKTPEIEEFIKGLPFELTFSQQEVLSEIFEDMESEKVMNRLVQGDVGSGKTIVALLAMIKAVRSGYQAAYMAPTEILAEQHLKNIQEFLGGTGISAVLIKGSQSKKQREEVLLKIKEGSANIVIGTHAIIQENVFFNKLGLVITDEQHRFGVRQRGMLAEKSTGVPDVLVMTATPIPRTLAMILYGDLDISVINTLPKGRIPIKTYVVNEGMRQRIDNFIIRTVNEGRQVYIVCPAIEEKEEEIIFQGEAELKKAEEYYREATNGVFRNIKVGLIHGKLKNAQKEETMRLFSEGEIQVLIATTVIEVGVDVPNASLIVIENSERFGLAQLHQLRGRVGRGKYQSYCVLYNQSGSDVSKERMDVMAKTTDGFLIAQKDLEIRGPGEFFGTRQHGIPLLKIANLYEDSDILKDAQKAAGFILENEYNMNEQKKCYIEALIRGLEELGGL